MIPAASAILARLDQWEADAQVLARRGDPRGAEMLRSCAAEVRGAMEDAGAEPLTLAQAAAESGFSEDHLRHLVASGQIPQAGRKGAPRIRRADLPRKPGAISARTTARGTTAAGGYDPDADALSLAGRLRAG